MPQLRLRPLSSSAKNAEERAKEVCPPIQNLLWTLATPLHVWIGLKNTIQKELFVDRGNSVLNARTSDVISPNRGFGKLDPNC